MADVQLDAAAPRRVSSRSNKGKASDKFMHQEEASASRAKNDPPAAGSRRKTTASARRGAAVAVVMNDEESTGNNRRKRPAKKAAVAIEVNDTPASSSAPAPTKRQRRSKAVAAAAPQEGEFAYAEPASNEERQDAWLAAPPPAMVQRIERALKQRLYLLQRTVISETKHEFLVVGSSGNVYTVKLFVMLKVLRVPSRSPLVYQKALLSTELVQIFATAARTDPTAIANDRVRNLYLRATGAAVDNEAALAAEDDNSGAVKQRPVEGDCPICFDTMEPDHPELVVFCRTACGNNVHAECFTHWRASQHGSPKCVYCRSEWFEAGGSKPVKGVIAAKRGGGFGACYVNVSGTMNE